MSTYIWGNEKTQFFDSLTPDLVLNAIESKGFKTSGRVMSMGAMENRVYDVEVYVEETDNISDSFRILKFYRPGRWTKKQIQDEHDFLFDLVENDIQVIAPIKIEDESVFEDETGLFFAIFPKKGGRPCVEWTNDLLEQMGRLLARMHNTGLARTAENRLKLDTKTFGFDNLEVILKSDFMLPEYRSRYEDTCKRLLEMSQPLFENINYQRIHGDCHHGNILLNNNNPFLIDFDDMSIGPRVQDIWMIAPGRDEYSIEQRNVLLDAYSLMTDFDYRELKLIEVLRSLRIIHFSAWIGHRYKDQAFKSAFPSFGTHQYWEKEIHDLTDQMSHIQDALNPPSYY
jgi:Ser/Thr protein kinase RdoA (MazF antagonist)